MTDGPPSRSPRTRTSLQAALIVAIACAIVGWNMMQAYYGTMAGARAQLSSLARSVAVEVSSTLSTADGLLKDTAALTPTAKRGFDGFLRMRVRINGTVLGLSVSDAKGRIRFSSRPALVGRSVADSSDFIHFRDHPNDRALFISPPLKGPHGIRHIYLARHLIDKQGRFAGMVEATISPGLFSRYLGSALPSFAKGGSALFGPTRVVLARVPDPGRSLVGRSLARGVLLMRHAESGRQETVEQGITTMDGVDRMVAFNTLRKFPITVAVSAPVASILQPWWRDLSSNLVILAVVILVALTVTRLASARRREQARASATIAAERDFSRTLITSLPGLFYLFDSGGRFLRWNANLETVTGRGATELATMHMSDLFEAGDREAIEGHIGDILVNGSGAGEAVIVAASGRHHPYYFSGMRMMVEGRPCVIGVGQDISELKQLQRSLELSNEDLRQFAYVAAHQLQEPLRVIAGYVQLLGRRYQGKLDEDADDFIGFAVAGVERMSSLIKDLLNFSLVSANAPVLNPVDCQKVVSTVIDDLAVAITDAGAKVTIDGTLPMVEGDGVLLATLFQNLIDNAIKYRAEGRPPQVTIAAKRAGPSWEFTVTDNGIGIDPEYFAKIFDLFQRLHRQTDYPGTGIGLTISRKIVEHHGGRIWATSEAGQGTCFHITLPAPAVPHPTGEPAADAAAPA